MAQAQQCDIAFLYRALELSNECDLNYRVSKNKRLLIELTLIRLCQILRPIATPTTTQPPIQPITPSNVPTNSPAPASASPQSQAAAQPSASVGATIPTNPIVSAVTDDAPKYAKPSFKPGISIKAPITTTQEVKTTTSSVEVHLENEFTENDLKLAWNEFETTISSDKLLVKKTLVTANLVLKEDKEFEVWVDSPSQIAYLEAESIALLTFLKKRLQNSRIRMSLKLYEKEENTKIYSKQEQFLAMANENPNLYKLKEVFGLEII